MNTLVAFFLILTGLFELSKLVYRSSIKAMIKEMERIAKKIKSRDDFTNLAEAEGKKFMIDMFYILCLCSVEIIEIAILLFATVYFTGTFRILIFSVFLLAFVAHYLKKILPEAFYDIWMRLDYLYCATVLIGGTLYFA